MEYKFQCRKFMKKKMKQKIVNMNISEFRLKQWNGKQI